jgi:hypothetical protein
VEAPDAERGYLDKYFTGWVDPAKFKLLDYITLIAVTQREGISLSIKPREVAMKNALQYRALASLFRQQAAYNLARKWHLLGQAERWEHLAAQELASHFEECNIDQSNAKRASDLVA